MTLNDFISDKFSLFNEQVGRGYHDKDSSTPPGMVLDRAFTSLLLLTQATKPEHNLTNTIICIAELLNPIMQDIGTHNRVKYNHLLDIKSFIHNRDYDEKEFRNRIVMACQPLEYILDWYFTSDKETPFDLNEYATQYHILKDKAEKVFEKSCWSK
jgi:hypothetical protein